MNLSQALRHQFDLAGLRSMAKKLKRPQDWEKANAIRVRYQQEYDQINERFHTEYDARVAEMAKKLIDQAGSKQRTLRRRFFGRDAFSHGEITEKAHRLVQHDHRRRIHQLEDREAGALRGFLNQIGISDRLRSQAKNDFSRATDRRAGVERRHGPRR